ncbi:MAG: hypothetical protein A3D65_03350 [Candidatus Lloydbacteria bacterium RIFCSPHIGHO2_02_FULL_50_13]|uniref:Uncharacterized protein n=1 Tax=Candidatus Lloydbacteria bacterium RIFCSPHIGHO2_02_FULL_50_13 TaxID=1798661 RepID=A0A1G2D993_9BACT|nr:MAG: hypothetical protein A3D65_03350 [Candidatus Lloydbacteria bacterium RIFCSPHIGHO2_02_FULL_50_13]
MFLQNIVEFLRRFPFLLRSMWVISLFVLVVGGGLNMLVIHANDGRMPVPTKAEGFYVIYPNYYRVALDITPDRRLITDQVHGYAVMTERSRLAPLANRFYLVTPINIWEAFPSALTIQFIRSDIPVLGQEMHASIGDILIWVADILFVFAAIGTIVFALVQGLKHQMQKLS